KKTYVHCTHGHGRAPTLVAAYLIKKGKSTKDALDFIKSKRPSIHLDDPQVDALIEYEKSIH
ncbi:dual specificity protein phosphatase family protein, partial [Candidatus Collierbacteria bacterium]|nr:dual specificity protein phosphatase family protein [Candidatus Collierbacteria bacterium]